MIVEKLKKVQLEILEEFIRICEINNLKWYGIAGTLLGAIRHSGYIPWDVDIDVAMMREDYDKFAEICETQLDSSFVYKSFENEKYHYSPHAKLYKENTRVILGYKQRNNKKHRKDHKGIYIDVFPLDVAPQSTELQRKQAAKLQKLRKLKIYKEGLVYENGFLYSKFIGKKIISLLLYPISLQKINEKENNTMIKYKDCKSDFVVSMASQYSYQKQLMPKSFYGTPKKMKFEDIWINIPEQPEKYLTQLYGDYMTLPPKEDRERSLKNLLIVETDV